MAPAAVGRSKSGLAVFAIAWAIARSALAGPPSPPGAALAGPPSTPPPSPPARSPPEAPLLEAPPSIPVVLSGALTYEAHARLVGLVSADRSYPLTGYCATGSGVAPVSIYGQTATARAGGAGVGVGARVGYLFRSVPEIGRGSSWWGLRAASGLDLDYLQLRSPAGIPPVAGALCERVQRWSHDVAYRAAPTLLAEVPLVLGVQAAFGGFEDGSTWRGVVLGIAWAPSLSLLFPSVADHGGSLRYLGAELTVDFASFELGGSSAGAVRAGGRSSTRDGRPSREAHLRVTASVSPAIDDDEPVIAKLGIGAVWY